MGQKHNGVSLPEFIEQCLRDGKSAAHLDFQHVMAVFGKEKIVKMALEIKEKIAKEKADAKR